MRRRRRRITYDRILVVGAGRAGVAAAEELRGQGFRGELTVLGEEPDPPYDRPSCSKGLLTGHRRPRDVTLPVREGTDVHWRLGRRAVGVDPHAQVVRTDTGEEHPFDGLVIATGAGPMAPPGWPVDEPGVHVLHGLADAWELRRALRAADRVVVVGGGLTGCETASAVRALARDCVLVDSHPQVMTRALGETAGGLVTAELRRAGVDLRLGRKVRDLGRRRGRWSVRLDNGSEVDTDLVVSTAGQRPDTRWLADVPGIDLRDGVRCDRSLRVAGVPGMVAAGTVARWPNLRYGPDPVRCGQWIAAMEQGRAAARALLAGDRWVPPVTLLPRFWSEQFGLRIQVCGEVLGEREPDGAVTVTELRPGRADVARAGMLVSHVRGGELVGLVAVNAPSGFTAMARALLATAPVLTDSTVPPDSVSTAPRRHLSAVA